MTDLELHPDLAPTPTTLFASASPAVVVQRATEIADAISPLIRQRNLYTRIGKGEHVQLEGWTLAGTMLGVFAATISSGPLFDTDGRVIGYQATVEARTMAGALVGRADAECTRDEPKWVDKDSFQLRSMAQTRASSKALRMPLGFVMKLAGYETTPAEEMEAATARGETVSGGRGVRPGWRDIAEQQRAHAKLGEKIDEHGLRPWVAEWCDSKGYERPMAKAQFNQLERAIDRELVDRAEQSGGLSAATDTTGDAVSGSPPDPSPSAPEQEEAPDPLEVARPGAEGANGRSGVVPPDDAAAPPESTAAPFPPGRRSSGGPNGPDGGAKGARRETPVRGRPAKPGESHGSTVRQPITDKDEQALFDKARADDDERRRRGFTS